MDDADQDNKRIHDRRPLDKPVQFVVQGEVIEAVSVDVSDGGIRLDTEWPVRIALRIGGEGQQPYEAALVWARRKLGGGMTYGFEYLTPGEA